MLKFQTAQSDQPVGLLSASYSLSISPGSIQSSSRAVPLEDATHPVVVQVDSHLIEHVYLKIILKRLARRRDLAAFAGKHDVYSSSLINDTAMLREMYKKHGTSLP